MPRNVYLRLYWTLVASFCALGVCVAFVQPVYSVPDENTHWSAAHARVEHLAGSDACVPTFLPERNRRKHPPIPPYEVLRSTELLCVPEDPTLYGDVLTYPGVLIAHLLVRDADADAEAQMRAIFVARLAQGALVAFVLLRLGALSLQAGSGGLLTAAAFAAAPTVAQQSFAVSSDGAQICFGLVLFAVIKFWDQLRWPDLLAFALFGWGAAAKPFAVALIIPSVLAGFWFAALRADPSLGPGTVARRLGAALKPSSRPTRVTVLLWLAVLLSAVTVAKALHTMGGGSGSVATAPAGPAGVDPSAQLQLLRSEPTRVLDIALHQTPPPWRFKSYAGPLGWLDAHLSKGTVRAFTRLMRLVIGFELVYALWVRRNALRARLRELGRSLAKASWPLGLSMLGPVFNMFLISLTLYITWTRVGRDAPSGLQARYYIPSVHVTIAAVAASLELLLGPREPELLSSPSRGEALVAVRAKQAARGALALAPLVLLALTIPLIVRVYLDLLSRYQ